MKSMTRNVRIAGIVAGLGYLVQAAIGLMPQPYVFFKDWSTYDRKTLAWNYTGK